MTDTEHQQRAIVLYAPPWERIAAMLTGILSLVLGFAFVLLGRWQLPALAASGLFLVGSVLLIILYWRLTHSPVLIINAEGIFSLIPLVRITLKWDEIDAIYGSLLTTTPPAFTVALSPAGLVSCFARHGKRPPRQWDMTVPQPALSIPQAHLSLPIEQLIAQIREQFAAQIERYHIALDEGQPTDYESI